MRTWQRFDSRNVRLLLAAGLGWFLAGCAGTVSSNPPGNNPPPATLQITALAATGVTASGASVTWTTNVAADSQVEYGTSTAYGQATPVDPAMVTNHSVALSNLAASTTYHFRVNSKDASGNLVSSSDQTFSTPAASDSTAPSVSIIAPSQGATVSGTVSVSADASDNVGVSGVQFQLDGASLGVEDTAAPYSIPWDTATTSNGTHNLTAVARDAAGNRTTSATITVTVLNNSGTVVRVGPAGNWCGAINGAAPGTTIILLAGNYTSPCRINASGTASAPLTVRSESSSAGQRAIMAYTGNTSNVIDISGSFLTLQWLGFNPTQDGVDAIRIHTGNDITVQENSFTGIGGVSVVYNDGGTVQRITVRKNTFRNLTSTGLYFGCHDGIACHATEILVEGNLIDGVAPTDAASVGYGIEIKLNSYGTIRDNTFYRTKGPCITIYGSNRGDPPSIVEGNYVEGSQTDAGINVSGGAAIVRNNIAVGNSNGGIWAQNYNGRGLQKNVWIVNNTVLNNSSAGIITQSWAAGNGNVLAFNAIAPQSGTNALSPSSPAGTITGNVICSPTSSCFNQPNTAPYDLWPVSGGPLIGAASSGSEPWRVTDDFMGVLRGSAADVGAFQRTGAGSGPPVGGGNPRPPRQ